MTDIPEVLGHPCTDVIDQLIHDCVDGKLPFGGPDSLCAKVFAMGYRITSLYEMVMACEQAKVGEEGCRVPFFPIVSEKF
jgi:hypothetical protein